MIIQEENFESQPNFGSFDAVGNTDNVNIQGNDGSDALVFRGKHANPGAEQVRTEVDTTSVSSVDVQMDYYELDTLDTGEGLTFYIDGDAAFRVSHSEQAQLSPPYITILNPALVSDVSLDFVKSGNFSGSNYYGDFAQGKDALYTLSFTVPTPNDTVQIGMGSRIDQNDEGIAIDNFSVSESPPVPCFGTGTMIATPGGARRIETLRAGELVLTMDNGPQPILWHGTKHVSALRMRLDPRVRPIALRNDAAAGGATLVSRQHCLPFRDASSEEIFVKAAHLARHAPDMARAIVPAHGVTYHHLLFERHQIIFGDGLPSESFFPGPLALAAITLRDRDRLRARFGAVLGAPSRARPLEGRLSQHLARRLGRGERGGICAAGP